MTDSFKKHALVRWLIAFGNPLFGSVIEKCLLLLATLSLPFSSLAAGIFSLASSHPGFAARIGIQNPAENARWCWLNVLAYALFFLVALLLRRRSPHNRVFLHCLLQYIWISLALAIYALGPLTSAVLIGWLGTWIVLCALFELRPVVYGSITALLLLIGLTVATHFGVIPSAPALMSPLSQGGAPTASTLVFGSLATMFLIAIMGMTGFLFTHLREHERELELLSTTDSLTQVLNRRSFLDTLDAELVRAARYQRQLALLMVDVDLFKGINDSFGHLAGDQVLMAVVSLLKDLLRRSDVVARFGGDEFIILLPETDLLGAQTIAERCRREIEGVTVLCASESVSHVTASIGIAVSLGVAAESVDDLIERADRALYTAKRNGRNRVEVGV